MESAIDQLYFHFVQQTGADAFPRETAEHAAQLAGLPLVLRDAVDSLTVNARITGFREGLRLGLLLAQECGLPPRPLP